MNVYTYVYVYVCMLANNILASDCIIRLSLCLFVQIYTLKSQSDYLNLCTLNVVFVLRWASDTGRLVTAVLIDCT